MKTKIFKNSTSKVNITQKSKNSFTKITLVLSLLLLMIANFSWGQTTIAFDSFENTATLFGSGGTYKSGTSSATLDRVASSPFAYAGTYALSNTALTLQSVATGDINTSAYTSVFLTLRVAAFSIGSTANGMESADYLQIEVSPDGGSNYYPTIKVTGASANNSYWAYSATGAPTTAYDGDATAVTTAAAAAGTNANGPSLLTITGLPQVSNLRIKITCIGNNAAEKWVFDDFLLKGTPSATPDILLADNGTQIAAANVTAGTSNQILHKFQLGVTIANASLTGLTCTTAGSYASADVTNLKAWYSADNSFATSGDNVLLSTLTTPGTAGAKTFTSFTGQTININSTGYIFITADIASGATPTNTISVNAITSSNLTLVGNFSGSTSDGGAQTIVAATSPTVTIGTIAGFGNQCINTTSGEHTYSVSGANLTADIALTAPTGYEISKTSGSGFGSSTTLLQSGGTVASTTIYVRFSPTLAQLYSGNITHTSTGATQQDLALTGTGTSPVAPSVSIAVTTGSNPTCPNTSVTFTATPTNGGTPTYQWKKDGGNVGTNSATYTDDGSAAGSITCEMTTSLTCVSSATATSNAISLTQSVPNVTSPGATAGNAQVSVAWSNPSCYDEIMIIAAPASNNGTPTGDGSAYTANLAYPTGTGLGNGYVAFKGTSSPQIITGLTNGTVYYFKIFTRKGSVWSAGTEVSATPVSGPCVTEDFETGVPTSYQTSQTSNTLTSGSWSMLNVMRNNTNQHGGSYCSQIKNAAGANATMPTNNTVSSVKFWCKAGTSGSNGLKVQKSVGGGAFVDVQTFTITTTNTQYTCNVNDNSSDVVIRFLNNTVQTLYLDDVELYCGTICTPPDAPTTTGGSVCNSGTVGLSASGATTGEVYKWYAASTGGTALKTSTDEADNTYTTASISASTNYYVTRFITATSCESTPRTVVAATVVSSATSIAPSTAQNVVVSANGSELTVTEGSAATSRVWKYGTSSGSYPTSTGTTTTTFTPNFGSAGTYYVVCESTYPAPCGVVTSNEVVINVVSNTITTSAISGSPFCAGASVSVPYTIAGTYTGGNVFTAQLSNSSGSFASPTDIGTATSTAAGTITATIPAGATTGAGYRIRVISTTPAITGNDNGTNLTINAQVTPSVTIAITTGANPSCTGSTVIFTPTPTNGGTPSYQWKVNGSNTLTGSTYSTTTLTTGDVVSCVMTTSATCPSVSTATSTGITMTVNAVPSISGTLAVCGSTTTTLTGSPAGGTWSSGTPANATVVSGTGVVTGVATGTSVITYTYSGCSNTATVNVTAPTITGTLTTTPGGNTTLTGAPTGGTWSSADDAIATINSSGVVAGVAEGSVNITYTASGCSKTVSVTISNGPCLDEGFTSYTAPAGWTFTGITSGSTYTSATYFGLASPSIKLENTGQRIETPTFTNAAELSFYCFVQTGFTSSLLIEGWDGSTWLTIDNNSTLPQSDAAAQVVYNASSSPALAPGFSKFRFTFTKNSGNVAFDDVKVTCSSTPYPEMAVVGNDQAIVDNDATPTTADFTDFGSVASGETLDRTFTIQNLGNGTLNLSGSPIVELTGSEFSMVSQPSASTIASSGTLTFTVRYTPATIGLATGTISIANDDPNESPYNFSIQGTGLAEATAWLIDEKFDYVTSAATINLTNTAGFTTSGTGILGGSTTAAMFNRSARSLTFTGVNGSTVVIETPPFVNGDLLSFWYKQPGTATNPLLVEQYSSAKAGWTTLATIPGGAAASKGQVYFYPIGATITKIRFTYTRTSNLVQAYLDDVRIRKAGECTTQIKILQTLVQSCGGDEGRNESVLFKTGNDPIKVDNLSVSFPNVSTGGLEFSSEAAQNFTTNATYVSALNDLVELSFPGCRPVLEPPMGVIPANSYAMIFTGSSPSVTYDFKAGCGSSTNYYAIFCNNASTVGRYGNGPDTGEEDYTAIIDKSTGCYDAQYYDSGIPNTAGELAAYDEVTRVRTYKNYGCEIALPIELASFTAKCNNGAIEVEWVTASETNNKHFTLERSDDLTHWSAIARVNGAGNSTIPLSYSYTDESRKSNKIVYYRLIQTDYDGKEETFSPITASCDQSADYSLNIYPNPANDQLFCDITNESGNTAKIEIINAYGQLVYQNEHSLSEGLNHLEIDLSKLKSGMYSFKLITPDGKIAKVKSLIKL